MAQDNKKPLYTLYNSLKSDNYDVPDTYESFERTLTAPGKEGTTNRMTLYNSLKSDNYDVPDTYESFANTLFGLPKTGKEISKTPARAALPPLQPPRSPGRVRALQRDYPHCPKALQRRPRPKPDQGRWQPSVQEKIRMMDDLNTGVAKHNKRTQDIIGRGRLVVERSTAEGRRKAQGAKIAAQIAGAPSTVLGLTPPPTPDAEEAGAGGTPQKSQAAQESQSPVPYGVKYIDGKPVTEWLLPDGSLTTNIAEADQGEFAARNVRLRHEFENRMKDNGLDVGNKDDVGRQTMIDAVNSGAEVDPQWRAELEEQMKGLGLDVNNKEHVAWMLGNERMILEHRLEDAEERLRGLNERKAEDLKNVHTFTPAGGVYTRPSATVAGQSQTELERDLEQTTAEVLALREALDRYDQNVSANGKGWGGKILQGLWDGITDPNTWTMGIADMSVNHSLRNADYTTESGRRLIESNMLAEQLADKAPNPGGFYSGAHFAGELFGDPSNWLVTGLSTKAASLTGRLAAKGLAKATTKGMTKEVAGRMANNSLRNRMLIAGAGQAGFFGTFDGLRDMRQQVLDGGWTDNGYTDDKGVYHPGEFHEGFSPWHSVTAAGKGSAVGFGMGFFGAGFGNVANWGVRASRGTVGKTAARVGGKALGFEVESTVFATPEMIDYMTMDDAQFDYRFAESYGYAEEKDPEKRKQARNAARKDLVVDAWTESQANLVGLKLAGKMTRDFQSIVLHPKTTVKKAIGDVASTLDKLRKTDERDHRTFRERVNNMFATTPFDIHLSKEDREELRRAGYDDSLFLKDDTEGQIERKDAALDGYDMMARLMKDPDVPMEIRAKAYYIVTGHTLPKPVITGWRWESEDEGYVVEAISPNGVVSRRTYATKKAAKRAVDDIQRQAELNSIDMGERYKAQEVSAMAWQDACEDVAERRGGSWTAEGVRSSYEQAMRDLADPDKADGVGQATRDMVKEVDEAAKYYTKAYERETPEAIRARLKKETGKDVDDILGIPKNKRTAEEQAVLDQYSRELFPPEETSGGAAPEAGGAGAESAGTRTMQKAREAGYNMTGPEDSERAWRNARYRLQRMYELFGNSRDPLDMLSEEFGTNDPAEILDRLGDSRFNAEERAAITEYLKAEETSQSITDRMQEETEQAMRQEREFIEKTTHEDGQIRPATMKVENRQVYIVKGNVVLSEDGSMINTAASDRVIYVYNPATDRVEQTSPEMLAGLGAPTSAEDTLFEMRNGMVGKLNARVDAMRGHKNTFNPGDTFEADIWGDGAARCRVTGIDEDGMVVFEVEGRKGQFGLDAHQLSAMIDNYKQEAFEADIRRQEEEAARAAEERSVVKAGEGTPGAPETPAEADGPGQKGTERGEISGNDNEGMEARSASASPREERAAIEYEPNDSFRVSVNGREGEMQHAAVVDREGDIITIWTPFPVTDKSEKGRTMAGYTTDISRAELDGIIARDEQGKPLDYVVANPEAEPSETPAGPEEAVIREGITGTADALKESFTVERERIGNEWLDTPAVQDAMRTYADGASTVEEIVERAKADSNDERTRQRLDTLLEFDSTRKRLQAMLDVPKTGETVPTSAEIPQNPTENAVSGAETVPTGQEAQAAADEPTALERIPRDEKGEPLFEQAESPEAGWDALVEFSEGDVAAAKDIVDIMTEKKRKAVERAQKQKPKGETPTEILASKKAISAGLAQAEQEYNLWQRMAGVEQSRQNAIRSQQEAEARRLAAERTEAEKAEREAREEAARLEREALEGIPEWHLDTPENARKRGMRRFSGQMFTRQEPVQGVVGKEVEVKFSQKDLPKGHLAVIEAPQLQPSHIQGQRNPMFFIEEAQPKNRAEAVSMFAAKKMAEGIRPQEITGSATAYTGAPTVNTRGEVIQGNNRSDALRYLWENKLPEQQQTYKQYLIDNAEQFGLDHEAVNAMQQPVLVNMLDVDDAEAIRLGQMTAQDTESGGIERIKPKNVAQKLGEDMRSFASQLLRSGDEEASFSQLVDRNGTEVMKWMAQKGAITNTQYQSAFDSKGNLTAEAKNDLQKVLYQAVFKGGSQQLEEMFDALPAKAQRAILSTAFRDMDSPFAGKMLPEIQSSIAAFNQLMNDPTFAAAKKMEEALRAVEAFKRSIQLDDRFEQYMPADNFSNFALHLAAMYKANDMSQSTLTSYFNQMYDLAQGKKAATLFEEADTTEYPLADVIKQVLNIDYKPAKNGNNNVANGGADVALRNQDGQGGELRGNEPPASGEQNPTGTEPSDRGAGASGDSGRGGNDSERQDNIPKGITVSSAERTEMESRIVDWLSDDNLEAAIGKSREEIFEVFGNELEPIAYVPAKFIPLLDPNLQDARIYCGKGYFIDHALRNHGKRGCQVSIEDVDVSKYLNIQAVLDKPDFIKETTVDGKRTVVFIKKIGRFFAELAQVEENGRIVLHKSLFDQKKEPYAKLNDIRQEETSSEGGVSSISHAEKSAPAISLESRGDVVLGSKVQTAASKPHGLAFERKVNYSASEKQESGAESSAQHSENKGERSVQTAVAAASAQVKTGPTQKAKASTLSEEMNDFITQMREAYGESELEPKQKERAIRIANKILGRSDWRTSQDNTKRYNNRDGEITGSDVAFMNSLPDDSLSITDEAAGTHYTIDYFRPFNVKGRKHRVHIQAIHLQTPTEQTEAEAKRIAQEMAPPQGRVTTNGANYSFVEFDKPLSDIQKARLTEMGLKEGDGNWVARGRELAERACNVFVEHSQEKESIPNAAPAEPAEATEGYDLDVYETKKGKKFHRVKFPRADKEVWKERLDIAKEQFGGTSVPGGYGFKDAETAKAFAEAILHPVSAEGLKERTDAMAAVEDFPDKVVNEDAVMDMPDDTAADLHIVDVLNPGMTEHSPKEAAANLAVALKKVSDAKLLELLKEHKDNKTVRSILTDEYNRRGGVSPEAVEAARKKPASRKKSTPKKKPEPAQAETQAEAEPQPEAEKKARSKWFNEEDQDEAADIIRKMKARLRGGNLYSGIPIDVELLELGCRLGYLIMKKGARKLHEYAEAMIENVGDGIRPYIKQFYNATLATEEALEGEWYKEATPMAEIAKFDAVNFMKERKSDVIETAKGVTAEQDVQAAMPKAATDMVKKSRDKMAIPGYFKPDGSVSAETKAAQAGADLAAALVDELGLDLKNLPEGVQVITADFKESGGNIRINLPIRAGYEPIKIDIDFDKTDAGALRLRELTTTMKRGDDLAMIIGEDHQAWLVAPGHKELLNAIRGQIKDYLPKATAEAKPEAKKPAPQPSLFEEPEAPAAPAAPEPQAKTGDKLLMQYEAMKKKHPDAVVLFRVGDFYETFHDDARIISETLGLTLTTRGGDKIPLAGFPHHALDAYLPKLVRAGKRVAICEQLEDPKISKQTVKRGTTPQRPKSELSGDSAKEQERRSVEHDFVEAVSNALIQRINNDGSPLTMAEVRKMAEERGLKDVTPTDLQELVERAVSLRARSIAEHTLTGGPGTQEIGFNKIVKLYTTQPVLSDRDVERIQRQQYSTPVPMGYVMNQFMLSHGHSSSRLLEPSAGNGALTIGVHKENCHVNDIDPRRLANLRAMGFKVITNQDALQPFGGQYDMVVTNPPFGTAPSPRTYDGLFEITTLEGQMAINALDSMTDNGRAAIIVGGSIGKWPTPYEKNGRLQKVADRQFFGYLYSHYNVVDIIPIDGKSLYSRNGTGYNVRMILIDGRRRDAEGNVIREVTAENRVFPPVREDARPEPVTTYDELYKRIQDDILRIQQRLDVADRNDGSHIEGDGAVNPSDAPMANPAGDRGGERPVGTGDSSRTPRSGLGGTASGGTSPQGGIYGRSGRNRGTIGQTDADAGSGDGSTLDERPGAGGRQTELRAVEHVDRSGDRGGIRHGATDADGGSRGNNADGARQRSGSGSVRLNQPKPVKVELTDEKVASPHVSSSANLMSRMPAAQAQEFERALHELEEKHGNVDEWLTQELGYADTADLYRALAAEQVEGVAMAIDKMNSGRGFIIADQTGIGKGRQAASIIRYAVRNGHKPIFFTQKAGLFSDMYRDLKDIGCPDLKPFIFGSDKDEASITERQDDGTDKVIYPLPKPKERDRVLSYIEKHGTLPDEYDYAVITYSQVQNGTTQYEIGDNGKIEAKPKTKKGKGSSSGEINGERRRHVIDLLSRGNYLILDEAHTAGGQSGLGGYMQSIIPGVKGITYLSATYAKRPDNMPLYAIKTAISDSGVEVAELINAVAHGGVPLQEIMSRQLVKSGEMARRERDFTGVTIDWIPTDEGVSREQQKRFDTVSEIFVDIMRFQDMYVRPYLSEMSKELARVGSSSGQKKGTKDMGIGNAPFASKLYNLLQQLLFSIKVDAVADRAIKNLQNGRKPIISFVNTMEGFLEDASTGMSGDGSASMPTLSLALRKALDGVMRYTVKDNNNNETHSELLLSQLGPDAESAYNAIIEKMNAVSDDLPIAPLDAIRLKIEAAGYKVGELSGRELELAKNDKGLYVIRNRKAADKKATAADFNAGKIDVLMVNKTGSTGISLHASSKFEDQRQRVMIAAQFQPDVNDEVQMRGRNDRTGQVVRGAYEYLLSSIPAEQRLQMMFKAKLKSLDANTTSSQKSSFNEMEVVDVLNKYGDAIVWDYLNEDPMGLNMDMGNPLGIDPTEDIEAQQKAPKKSNKDDEDDGSHSGFARKALGRLALLPIAEQERVMSEITERYQRKIHELDERGENDLEISYQDLKAKTLGRKVWVEGKDPDSGNAFADNVYMEQVEVNVLDKPLTGTELAKYHRTFLEDAGVETWDEWLEKKTAEIDAFYENRIATVRERITANKEATIARRIERFIATAKDARAIGKNSFTDEEITAEANRRYGETERQEAKAEIERETEKIRIQQNLIKRRLTQFKPMSPLSIPDDLTDESKMNLEPSTGVMVGIKLDSKYSLNGSQVVFAPLDGRRTITLSLKEAGVAFSKIGQASMMMRDVLRNFDLSQWDSHISNESRETRYMLTGNILRALVDMQKTQNARGRIAAYTTEDGEVRTGILMSPKFKPADLQSSAPMSSMLARIMGGEEIKSSNGEVTVRRTRGWSPRGDYEVLVPKSKKRGGKYYLPEQDPVLARYVVGGFEMPRSGSQAIGYVRTENLARVLDHLSTKHGATVMISSKLKEATQDGIEYRTPEEGVEYVNARAIQPWSATLDNLRFRRDEQGMSLTSRERERLRELSAQEKAWEEKWNAEHMDTDLPTGRRSRFDFYAGQYGQGGMWVDMRQAEREAGPLRDADGRLISANARDMARRALPIIMRRRADLLAERPSYSRAGQAAIDEELADLEYMALYYQRMEAGEDVARTMPGRLEHQRMLAAARDVAAALGEKVVLYEAPSDIVDSDYGRRTRKRRSYGWYNPNDGTMHINVGRHKDAQEIVKTALHEIIGHKTIEQIMGPKRFARLIEEIWNHAGRKVRAKIAAKMGKNGWDFREATKEYLGELAEEVHTKGFEHLEAEKKTLWQRMKAKIQDFLNRILEGMKIPARIRLTENDLSYMMWKLYKHKERKAAGKPEEGDIFDKAEEIVRREQWEKEGDSLDIAARGENTLSKRERIEKLRNSESAVISGNEIEISDNLAQTRKNAVEYGKTLQGEYVNDDTGNTIQLQRGRRNGGIKELLQHDMYDDEHIQSIAALPQIIEKGIYIDSTPNNDRAKNSTIDEYQHYVCGLKIGNEDYTVHSIVAVDINGQRYYDHKLSHIEKGKLLDFIEAKQSKEQILAPLPSAQPKDGSPLTIRSERKINELISLLQVDDEIDTEMRYISPEPEYRPRQKPVPRKTVKVYKLVRVKEGRPGEWFPLFIDSASPLRLGEWLDADSPDLEMLRGREPGQYLVNPQTKEVLTREEVYRRHPELRSISRGHDTKYPSVDAINYATENGLRWMEIEETDRSQHRFGGENRRYWNLGINGSGSVSTFSLRPGWHAGSLPTMRQIGKGKNKDLRDDNFVWVEGEISADIDYQAEAERNPDKDLPDRIPEDGYYMKATNANKATSQADRVGWYVAGSFKANRFLSDAEARKIIDDFNAAHPDMEPVAYDYERESGRTYDPEAGLHFRDGEEERESLRDMTIEEQTLKMAMMLADRHAEDVAVRDAAVEALGKTLGNIRKAMAAQHTYDFNTVRSLSKVADMLISSGTFLPEGPGEVKRLYGIMKRGIGHAYTDKNGVEHVAQTKKDFQNAVDSLMDLFVSNQLKLSEKFLDEVMKIRGSKVNARGVEVMGDLDAEGQIMVRGMKEYMKTDAHTIRDRIDALDEIIATGNDAASLNAAAEKLGLEMAERYVEEVSDRTAQEKIMRGELDDMPKQWNASMSGDARKAYIEQKRALEESIRKIRIERAEAMRQLASQIGNELRNSIERVKAFREQEKQRIEEIRHNANSDMTGRAFDEHGMKKKGIGVKLSNNMLTRLLFAPAATFEQVMRVFGSKSIDGEGYLFDRFVRGWQECRDREWTSTQEVEGILNKKAAEILGKRKARWSDLYALTNKAAGSCEWWDGGQIREHKVTQGNLMYLYMVNKMTDGRVKLRRMCITEEKMAEIERTLDPRLKQVADWIQEELLPNLRNRYNEVHMRMYGAPMAEIENYFPLMILANARLEEVEMAGKIDGKDLPKTMTGAIIKRRFNNYAFDVLNSDAVSIALDHIREMETWAAFAEYRRDLCTLLSYKHFRNQVKNMSTIYGSGEKFWDKFYDLALLVGGAYQPKTSEFDKVAVNITKLATGACIAIRISTALKQLLSYPAFAPDANMGRLLYNMTPGRARKCWQWAIDNMPAFQRRWESRQAGNDLLREWKHDWDWTRAEFVQKVQRFGITPNAFIDALTVAMGSEAIYQSKLKRYIKDGFSKDEAHRRAIQDAEIIFNLSQQSSELPYLSLLQNDRSYLTTCITNFRNSPMSYLRQSIQSKRELINMIKSKETMLEFETKKGVREGLTFDQAKARAERKFRHNWVRNLFKSATFDFILPALWAFGLSGMWYCIFGDDDKKKRQYAEDAIKRGMLGGFEGLTFGGTLPDFFYGLATGDNPQLDEETSPAMGLITDMANLYSNGKTERAANEMINTMIALGVGVNPQVLEDGVVAGMDFFGEDEKSSRDWAMLFMRVIQCPQSQMDQVYFDELGMNAREASGKSPAELAERYATYKARRANFATMWKYDDERWETEVKEPWRKRFEMEAKERLKGQSEDRINESLEKYDAEWSQTGQNLRELAKKPSYLVDKAAEAQAIFESPEGTRYRLYNDMHPFLNQMIKSWLKAPTAEEAATEAKAIMEYKAKVVEMLDSWDNPSKSRAAGREAMRIASEWHDRQKQRI